MKILIAAEESKQRLAVSLLAPPHTHMLRQFSESEGAILSICRSSERNDPYQAAALDMEVAGWDEVALFLCDLRRDLGLRCELIFVSGSNDLDLRLEAAELGAAGFLVWPEKAEDLPSLVNALESL